MNLLSHPHYQYRFDPKACETCGGRCCTGESGYIWITLAGIEQMAHYLNLDIEQFSIRYLRKVGHRYSLIEKKISQENHACIFFDTNTNRCSVYEVRPNQCRTFPFWEQFQQNHEEVIKECPGIVI